MLHVYAARYRRANRYTSLTRTLFTFHAETSFTMIRLMYSEPGPIPERHGRTNHTYNGEVQFQDPGDYVASRPCLFMKTLRAGPPPLSNGALSSRSCKKR